MKTTKKLLSLVLAFAMVATMAVPAFASSESDCTEGHTPPNGYAFSSKRTGTKEADAYVVSIASGLIGLAVPALGATIFIATSVADYLGLTEVGDVIENEYDEYTYYHGASSGFWVHRIYYLNAPDGTRQYLSCTTDRHWVSNK